MGHLGDLHSETYSLPKPPSFILSPPCTTWVDFPIWKSWDNKGTWRIQYDSLLNKKSSHIDWFQAYGQFGLLVWHHSLTPLLNCSFNVQLKIYFVQKNMFNLTGGGVWYLYSSPSVNTSTMNIQSPNLYIYVGISVLSLSLWDLEENKDYKRHLAGWCGSSQLAYVKMPSMALSRRSIKGRCLVKPDSTFWIIGSVLKVSWK